MDSTLDQTPGKVGACGHGWRAAHTEELAWSLGRGPGGSVAPTFPDQWDASL